MLIIFSIKSIKQINSTFNINMYIFISLYVKDTNHILYIFLIHISWSY